MRKNGDFILLKNGVATCYASDYATVRGRLIDDFSKDPSPEYCIVQIMATVAKPKVPAINSIYEETQGYA
jgi:hypothetical protein